MIRKVYTKNIISFLNQALPENISPPSKHSKKLERLVKKASSGNTRSSSKFDKMKKAEAQILKQFSFSGAFLDKHAVKDTVSVPFKFLPGNANPPKWDHTLLSIDQIRNEMTSRRAQSKSVSEFKKRTYESRKLRVLYGNLSRRDLRKAATKVNKLYGGSGDNLLMLLETRLDVSLQRCGFFPTIRAARQFVVHKKVQVNFKLITSPGYQLNPGDIIKILDDKGSEFSSSHAHRHTNISENLNQSQHEHEHSKAVSGAVSESVYGVDYTSYQQLINENENESGLSELDQISHFLAANANASGNAETLDRTAMVKFTELSQADRYRKENHKQQDVRLTRVTAFSRSEKVEYAPSPQLLLSLLQMQSLYSPPGIMYSKCMSNSAHSVQEAHLPQREVRETSPSLKGIGLANASETLDNQLNPIQGYKLAAHVTASVNTLKSILWSTPVQTKGSPTCTTDTCSWKYVPYRNSATKDVVFVAKGLVQKYYYNRQLLMSKAAAGSYNLLCGELDISQFSDSQLNATTTSNKSLFWESNIKWMAHQLSSFIKKRELYIRDSSYTRAKILTGNIVIIALCFLLMVKTLLLRGILRPISGSRSTQSMIDTSRSRMLGYNRGLEQTTFTPGQKRKSQFFANQKEFYQRDTKPLHFEVSYQSLCAILLYPPQRVYATGIIDTDLILKHL